MKKLSILLILVFFYPVFTGMTVVYDKADGKVKTIGTLLGYKPQEGEGILSVASATPDQIDDHVVINGEFQAKTKKQLEDETTAKTQEITTQINNLSSALEKLQKVVDLTDDELVALKLKEKQ